MKSNALLFFLLICISSFGQRDEQSAKRLEGRWDLTLTMNGKQYPSWLEVTHSGHKTLVGRFVGISGSARPVSEVKLDGDSFSFAIPPQWENGNEYLRVIGKIGNVELSGSLAFPDGQTATWTGRKAPSLRKSTDVKWGKPISLIQPGSLKGWKALGENQWVVENNVLKSPKSGANLVTEQSFTDFKLHIEFRYPEGSNSGVYLRRRYEIQITDSFGKEPSSGEFGGVYGFISPSQQVAKAPGEWQTYDITLIGRMVTLTANGQEIICNQEIPGITGGAIDSDESEPGPLLLQGDHGPIEYRNIVITPIAK